MNFSQLTPNAERLLQEILDHRLENGNCDINYWSRRFTGLSFADDSLLRSQFKVLSDYELIRTSWANNRPYIILITEYGYSYFEQKQKLEKEKQEAVNMADKQVQKLQASTIVNGQPIVEGLRIMDTSAEETLQIILKQYDGNVDRVVKGKMNAFPKSLAVAISVEFEKLCMYGAITSPHVWIDGSWELYLTQHGIKYFVEKEKTMQKNEQKTAHNKMNRKQYDVFISHASKDKSDYVESLYMCLRRLGVSIFYDSDSISWGDNWKKAILDGTAASEFAIIVISENFFAREWTERELNKFLKLQNESGQKIVLPLLHKISRDQLKAHYPKLEEIQVIDTATRTEEDITILFAKELIKRLR